MNDFTLFLRTYMSDDYPAEFLKKFIADGHMLMVPQHRIICATRRMLREGKYGVLEKLILLQPYLSVNDYVFPYVWHQRPKWEELVRLGIQCEPIVAYACAGDQSSLKY